MKISKIRVLYVVVATLVILPIQMIAARDIPEELIGVWQSEGIPVMRIEIQSDGTMTTWSVKNASYPLSTRLHLLETQSLRITADNRFRIGDSEATVQFQYDVTVLNPGAAPELQRFRLHFGREDDPKVVFKFKSIPFGDERWGSYELHRNHAFGDLVRTALEATDLDTVRELLESPVANFLRAPDGEASIKAGKSGIRADIWRQALETRDPGAIKLIYEKFPEAYHSSHLAAAIESNDPEMTELLTVLTRSQAPELSPIEQSQFDHILTMHQFLEPSLLRSEYYAFGCGRQQGKNGAGQIAEPELLAERRQYATEWFRKDAEDGSFREKTMEEEFARCLQSGYNGSFSSRVLNAISVTDKTVFGGAIFTTPLYYYGSLQWAAAGMSDRLKNAANIKYGAINALLDAGADHTVKPSPDHDPLAAVLYQRAFHTGFRRALKQRSESAPPGTYAFMIAKIDSFNRIMRRIGGPEYDASRSPEEVYSELKARTVQSVSVMPETATEKPAPTLDDTIQVVATAPSPAELIGCWKWSNGLQVSVEANGSVNSGIGTAPWRETSDKSFEIDWPDITGYITLSTDGQRLDAVDNFGIATTAQRLNGDTQGFVGTWQWSNGGAVTIAEDGSMKLGPLTGRWSAASGGYEIVWPILDAITVLEDGNALHGSNQFGTFSAKKSPDCTF